jgi:NADPH2:quinone reductase
MKAMLLSSFGPPSYLQLAEVPSPVPQAGELLIRVEASSVNPIDAKIRSGILPAISPALPAVLHGDVVGTILKVGAGVTGWNIGQRVWSCAGGFKGLGGALAEEMRLDARMAALAPANLAPETSAALPVVSLTAWQAVVERGNVRPGHRVLIHGGTGGVGHVAIQLAKLAGAHVTATVSSREKAPIARTFGADDVLLSNEVPCDSFDVVIDTFGGPNLNLSFQQIVIGGTVVTTAARTTADLTPLHGKGATFHVVFVALPLLTGRHREAIGDTLKRITSLVESGHLRPLIAKTLPFTQAAEAHALLESRGVTGKIVLAGW